MTGLNHALTGAVVAAAINEPALALPAAFLSHFAIDILPHWDYKVPRGSRGKQIAMAVDLVFSAWVIMALTLLVNAAPWLIIAGGLLGILPDAFWLVKEYVPATKKFYRRRWAKRILEWHSRIQWSETRKGLYFEIVWFVFIFIIAIHIRT